MTNQPAGQIRARVRQAYGQIARQAQDGSPASCCGQPADSSCCSSAPRKGPTSCCESAPRVSCGSPAAVKADEAETGKSIRQSCCSGGANAAATCEGVRLYPQDGTGDLPDTVTGMSLGCGNPTAIAGLQPGEVVLDLGSGAGIDCFLASRQVGSAGKVIGLDVTAEMVKLARRNAKKMGVTNVDFRYGEIEEMPIPDESVDVIISNCVINLSPDKDAVFAESFRVLRPGGRVAVSDVVTNGDLPLPLRRNLDAWAGCVSGALDEAVYLDKMRAAGLTDICVERRTDVDIESFLGSEDAQMILGQTDPSSSVDCCCARPYCGIASITVSARKPA